MKSSPPLRLFIAVYPPQGWVDAASQCLPIIQMPPGRSTPPAQLHLTMAFLGDRLERDLPKISESIRAAVAGMKPFDLSTIGLAMLPEEGTPRLIAANLTSTPHLLEAQKRITRRLVSKRRETAFVPHITLFRFANESEDATLRERTHALLPAIYLQTFRVSELALVASVLHPLGVRHRVIDRIPLGQTGQTADAT